MFRRVFILVIFLTATSANARQVEGRATIKDDCTPSEHWVTEHAKSTGAWTSFCRKNKGISKFWRNRIKNSRPAQWPNQKENSKKWSEFEILKLLDTFHLVPGFLLSESLVGLYRMDKSKDRGNPASTGLGHIVLYDDAFNKNLAQILTHELAHLYYMYSLSDKDKKDYNFATGWGVIPERKNMIFFRRESGYIEDDGKTGPEEDFTNNIEAYFFREDQLRQITPNAHGWIKKHINDKKTIGVYK